MKNDMEIESKIIDYVQGRLNTWDHTQLKDQIDNDPTLQKLEKEYRTLFATMGDDIGEKPKESLKHNFELMLSREQVNLDNSKRIEDNQSKKHWGKLLIKVASILLLILAGYIMGSYKMKKQYVPEFAELSLENNALKKRAALTLFKSVSASERIQATQYSQELEVLDDDILKVLIDEMLNDNLVNVRLASARALERFSHNELVKNAFIEALKNESNPSMQIELIDILVHIKEKRAIPEMKALLQDEQTPGFIKNQLKTDLEIII